MPIKCTLPEFCTVLNSKIEDANHKGFVSIHSTNLNNGEQRLLGIAYKTSVRDPGVMLNFCPFCGERIDWFNNPQT